jgi:hypothetical protein
MALPPIVLQPGWYWHHYVRSRDLASVDAFISLHRGQMKVRKIFSGDTSDAQVIVFEVVGGALTWTLSGKPTKAPKGIRTELKDLADGAVSSPSLKQLLDELGGTGSALSTAAKVVIFGGAAVLLWNLYQATNTKDD